MDWAAPQRRGRGSGQVPAHEPALRFLQERGGQNIRGARAAHIAIPAEEAGACSAGACGRGIYVEIRNKIK